jgi:CheY-like chemotaxis protein
MSTPRLQLLIVEDSALIRNMYELAFSQRDHDLVEAANGRAGAGRARGVVRRLRRDPPRSAHAGYERRAVYSRCSGHRFADIPIIVTTAEPGPSELLRVARELGVAAVLANPWKPQDLIRTVASIRSAAQL